MNKFKDIIKKDKDTVIIYAGMFLAVSGLVTDLYLSKHSEHKSKKSEKIEISTPVQNVSEEELKVCDYSMKNAFKLGLVNSISDYVSKTPYKVDTVKIGLNNLEDVSKGYYTKITSGDSTQSYITLNYIDVDTNDIPEPVKELLLNFAEQSNDSIAQKSVIAHEIVHKDCQEVEFNMTSQSKGIYRIAEEEMGRFNSFIFLREEFKKNNDPKIFKSSDYRFYYYALKRGDINPFSPDSLAQRNEQLFVLRHLFNQFNQKVGDTYDDEIVDAIKKMPEYDHTRPDDLNRALDQVFTTIWDGQLVNINPISTGELEIPQFPPKTQQLINCLTSKEKYKQSLETSEVSQEQNTFDQFKRKEFGNQHY